MKNESNIIFTDTWLNSRQEWLKFFPFAWKQRLTVPRMEIENHLGVWGQFLTGRETFSHAVGEMAKKIFEMPYALCESWCTIEELENHLKSFKV